MKSFAAIAIAAAFAVASTDQVSAFAPTQTSFASSAAATSAETSATALHEYIPSGMSKEQWNKIKTAEKNKNKGKNLGKTGITSFKSRSFAEWQASGGKNLFPVDPKKVKDPKDIPYMQRAGGSADDADLKKGKGGGMFGMFGGAKKAKKPEPAPEPEKKTNWWTL